MNLVHRLGIISFPSAVLSLSLLLHLAAVTAKYAAASTDMHRVVFKKKISHEMKSVSQHRLLSSSSFSRRNSNCPAAAAFLSCRGRNTNNTPSTGISSQSNCFRGGAKSPHPAYHSIDSYSYTSSTRRHLSNQQSEPREESLSGTANGETKQRQRHCISYLTDVEGDRDYLDRFVDQSRILTFRPTEPRTPAATTSASEDGMYFPYHYCLDFQNDDATNDGKDILVYGGDVWDQGGSDLYVIRQLLDLQRRYPDRVHLVMGNRDLNKMRVVQEMGEASNNNDVNKKQLLPPHGGVYWLKGTGRFGDPDKGLMPNDNDPGSKCAADRLRWMLKDTMGSPKAFEHRRSELEQEQQLLQQNTGISTNDSGVTVTDDQVVESYRASCHPVTGEMGRYLANARLVVKLGDALFVHGCLPLTETVLRQQKTDESIWDDLTFAMPWLEEHETAQDKGVLTITDWVSALNDFGIESVQAWKEESTTGGSMWSTTGGYQHSKASQLVQYGMGDKGVLTVTDWVSALNDFGVESVRAWRKEPATGGPIWSTTGGYHHSKASQLVQYGMGWVPGGFRRGIRNPTVVYASWCLNGMPRRFFPPDQKTANSTSTSTLPSTDSLFVQATRDFFQRAGVTVICSGHQPQGDMPNAIRVDYNTGTSSDSDSNSATKQNDNIGVPDSDSHPTQRTGWILSCDTSYSGDTHWHNIPTDGDGNDSAARASTAPRLNPGRGHGKSGRGDLAVSEVVMEQCSETGKILSVYSHGTLSDGTVYETRELDLNNGATTTPSSFSSLSTTADADLVVGRLASGPLVPNKANSPHGEPWWTRAAFRDGSYLLTAGEGYNVWNLIVKP
jgi:hypothetical protein